MPLVLELSFDKECVWDPFSICDAFTNFLLSRQVADGEGYKFFDGEKVTFGTHFYFCVGNYMDIPI